MVAGAPGLEGEDLCLVTCEKIVGGDESPLALKRWRVGDIHREEWGLW